MFNLSIFLIGSQVQYLFGYKDEGTAKASRENIHTQRKKWVEDKKDNIITVKDDYGSQIDMLASQVGTVLIEDHTSACQAAIDRETNKRRVDHAFLEKRGGDLELIKLFPQQGGMHHPMGGHA